MVRKLIITSLTVSALSLANAQYKFDFGARLGAANYLGDIGGKEQTRRDFIWDMKMRQTRWVVGGFARYRFNKYVGVNVGLTYLRIQGDDKLTTNPARRARNLNFRNDMLDLTGRVEGYFFSTDDLGKRGRYYLGMRAYAFAGISGLLYGPKTLDTKEKLRPLQTEGVKYSILTANIPMGFGLYFTHKRENRFGFEMCWMKTFSDYLDDISTTYVDPSTLPNDRSRVLYNRNPELSASEKAGLPSDIYYGYKVAGDKDPVKENKRGDDTHKDAVLTTSFTYSRVLPMYGPNTLYRQHGKGPQGRVSAKRKIRAKF